MSAASLPSRSNSPRTHSYHDSSSNTVRRRHTDHQHCTHNIVAPESNGSTYDTSTTTDPALLGVHGRSPATVYLSGAQSKFTDSPPAFHTRLLTRRSSSQPGAVPTRRRLPSASKSTVAATCSTPTSSSASAHAQSSILPSLLTQERRKEAKDLITPFASQLFRSSLQTLLSVYASWFFGHYDCTLLTSCVVFTSILYWHHATHGWRRHLDMAVSISTACYHVYKSFLFSTFVFSVYFTMFLILTYSYWNARQCTKVGNRRGAALWHMLGLHSFGNLCNLFFYAATCVT